MAEDHTTCPHCGADLTDGEFYRTIGVQIRGVYDGVLFWACPFCHGTWDRWGPGKGWRYAAGATHRAAYERAMHEREAQTEVGGTPAVLD